VISDRFRARRLPFHLLTEYLFFHFPSGKTKIHRPNRLGGPHHCWRASYNNKRVYGLILEPQDWPCCPRQNDYPVLTATYGVPRSILMPWHNCIKSKPEWTPADNHWVEYRRIFDNDTEANTASFIPTNFAFNHRLFRSEDFLVVPFARDSQICPVADVAPSLCCSRAFIRGFMVRNRFSMPRE
jgi:hypothetical protein